MLWMTFALLLTGTVCDLRRREIPDVVPFALLALAVVAQGLGWTEQSWVSLLSGWAVGLGVGAALFWLGGLGGGDVKVLSAVGAVLGLEWLLSLLLYTALAGGVMAAVTAMRGGRDVAYMPAITAGFAVVWLMRSLA